MGDVETLARAVRSAADAGATVINISSVACMPAADPLDDRSLGAALAYAVDVRNVVVVAAAGNASGECTGQNPSSDPKRPGTPDWDTVHTVVSPAWYDDYVLTVGSVSPNGTPSPFSLAGPWSTSPRPASRSSRSARRATGWSTAGRTDARCPEPATPHPSSAVLSHWYVRDCHNCRPAR